MDPREKAALLLREVIDTFHQDSDMEVRLLAVEKVVDAAYKLEKIIERHEVPA